MKNLKTQNPSDLKKHLGFWLRMISNHVHQAFAAKLASSGVTVAEWVILREIFDHEEGLPPSQISDATGLSRGAVSKLVDRLLAKELVTRTEAKNDRRFQKLELTKTGRNIVPVLASLADQNDEEFFACLRPVEQKILQSLLMDIAKSKQLTQFPVD